MGGRKRTSGTAVSSVHNPRGVKTSPPRQQGCPFLELRPDELGELMSPTLDFDLSGPLQGTPESGSGMPDYDHFLSVLGGGRSLGRIEAGEGVRKTLMVHCLNG